MGALLLEEVEQAAQSLMPPQLRLEVALIVRAACGSASGAGGAAGRWSLGELAVLCGKYLTPPTDPTPPIT